MKKAFVALIILAVALIALSAFAGTSQHPRHVADLSFVGVTDRSEVVLSRDTAGQLVMTVEATAPAVLVTIARTSIHRPATTCLHASTHTVGNRPRDVTYVLRC